MVCGQQVRLTGELVNGKVFTASDFLALCHTLLGMLIITITHCDHIIFTKRYTGAGFVNSDDTASSALDSVLYTVLTALPYVRVLNAHV